MIGDPARPLEGFVLAAGLSRRAGTFKPAAVMRGKPLVVHAAAGLRPACRRVVVVTGHRGAEVEALLAGLDGVATVTNPRYREDMFLSVQAGARAVAPDVAGFFVLPVDCPFVPAAVVARLVGAFADAGGRRAVVPVHAGRGGHPVLLPAAARAAILDAPPGTTLRDVAAAHDPLRVAAGSAAVLADLDTPDDLAGTGGAPA